MAVKSLAALLFTLAVASAEVKETESGLKVEYISKPDACDKGARNGDMLSMHYVGTLESGAKFDSSYDRSEPFKFQIGVGQVIKGWEEGVLGMCAGEKRRLIVPASLGYGDQGAGDIIPGGATLYFDVELMGVEEGPTPVNVFAQIDADVDAEFPIQKREAEALLQFFGAKETGIVALIKSGAPTIEEDIKES